MSKFKELNPELIWKLLEGQEDVLTPLARTEQTKFHNSVCPSCKSVGHDSFVNPKQPFSPGSVLPNKLLRCINCKTEYDPFTGLVIS